MDGPLPPPLGDMLMILPKGIVENTAEIYAEVASYPVVPPEKICEYWHVYTTTFRKLVDPTASRLENFWWHVWGSDRRYLSGRTLAKIYEEISTGPTIAPLRCPLNRYEGPPTPRRSQHELDGQREKERKQVPERERPGSSDGQDDGEPDASPPPSKKERTSSSAKPPPTHSILKKPRGPSASGPRPTARFISPHASEDEAKKDDEGSSGSTAVAGQEMRPPPPVKPDKKSGASSTKKFVASSSASKRRPALTRRPSSQSSTGSDVNFRDAGSSSGSRSSAVQRGLPPPIAENTAPRTAVPRSQGSSASSTQGSVLSARTAGKRPAATRTASDKRAAARGAPASVEEERPVVVQAPAAAAPAAAVPQRPSHSEQPLGPADSRRNMEAYEATRLRRDSSRSTAQAAGAGVGAVVPPTTAAAAPRMARSQSSQADHHYQQRHRDLSLGRPPPQGLVASSIAATSQVAAQGQFDSENSDPAAIFAAAAAGAAADSLSHAGTPSGGLTSRPSSSSLLEPRFTPTQPNPAPAVPFGRSKSQLTLLLEREKARIGDLKPKTVGDRLGDGDEP